MCKCGPTGSAPWTNHRTNARREGTGMIIWSGTYRSAAYVMLACREFGVPATRNREEGRLVTYQHMIAEDSSLLKCIASAVGPPGEQLRENLAGGTGAEVSRMSP